MREDWSPDAVVLRVAAVQTFRSVQPLDAGRKLTNK
jgi:hypothetical protein